MVSSGRTKCEGTSRISSSSVNVRSTPGALRDNSEMLQVGNPSGRAYSTVGDMIKFANALTSHKLLTPALTDTVLAGKVATTRPGGPPEDQYAYGFQDQNPSGAVSGRCSIPAGHLYAGAVLLRRRHRRCRHPHR